MHTCWTTRWRGTMFFVSWLRGRPGPTRGLGAGLDKSVLWQVSRCTGNAHSSHGSVRCCGLTPASRCRSNEHSISDVRKERTSDCNTGDVATASAASLGQHKSSMIADASYESQSRDLPWSLRENMFSQPHCYVLFILLFPAGGFSQRTLSPRLRRQCSKHCRCTVNNGCFSYVGQYTNCAKQVNSATLRNWHKHENDLESIQSSSLFAAQLTSTL